MSHDLNDCKFIGRLGADPEPLKYTPSGVAMTKISLAVGWKSKDKEGTEWVRISFFGKLAETVSQYLRKGSQAYVSGRMNTRSWDKDGVKHYSTEIQGEKMQMLGGKRAAEGQEVDQPGEVDGAGSKDEGPDDDLPF